MCTNRSESTIKSFDATIINSEINNLNDSEKKVINSLKDFNDFLKSYKDLNLQEKQQLSNLVGTISYKVGNLTVLVNLIK